MGSATEKFNTKQNKEEKCRVARHEKVFAEHGKEWNKEKWISWNVWGKSTGAKNKKDSDCMLEHAGAEKQDSDPRLWRGIEGSGHFWGCGNVDTRN
jgi:hypothetical protein